MAYISANQTRSLSIIARISDFLATSQKSFADHRLYVRTMSELKSLSNRELNDLGLSRSSLHDIAYQAVYGN